MVTLFEPKLGAPDAAVIFAYKIFYLLMTGRICIPYSRLMPTVFNG